MNNMDCISIFFSSVDQIENLEKEVSAFRQRQISKVSFTANLCSFENIDCKDVIFEENHVRFTGKERCFQIDLKCRNILYCFLY